MSSGNTVELAPDLTKAFGIALVVFGHVLNGLFGADIVPQDSAWGEAVRLVYLFHMPLFFYVSGLFIQHSVTRYGAGGVMRKTAEALLLPLIVWSYLQFGLQYLAGGNANNAVELSYVLTAPVPPRQQFWFLGVLFAVTVLVSILLKFHPKEKVLGIFAVALFLLQALAWDAMISIAASDRWLFLLIQTVIHLPFFLMGMVLGTETMRRFRLPTIVCLTVFTACLACFYFWDLGPVRAIASIGCVLAVYKIALNIADFAPKYGHAISVIAFVGMNSMIIFLAHVILAGGLRTVLTKMGIDSIPLHVLGGVTIGLLGPLLLVPIGVKAAGISPRLARAVLPVRYKR